MLQVSVTFLLVILSLLGVTLGNKTMTEKENGTSQAANLNVM